MSYLEIMGRISAGEISMVAELFVNFCIDFAELEEIQVLKVNLHQ